MRFVRPTGRDQLRAELQQAAESVERLAADPAQGREARNLDAVSSHIFAALQALARDDPAEMASLSDDPQDRAAQLITAALIARQLVEEMSAALATAALRIEAVPIKADLLELTAQMDALDKAFELVAFGIVRSHVRVMPTPDDDDQL